MDDARGATTGRRAARGRGRPRAGARSRSTARARATARVAVAIADPDEARLAELEATLGRPVEPRLSDEATLDELLDCVYADADADEVTRALREEAPELSAYRTMLSQAQALAGVRARLPARRRACWPTSCSPRRCSSASPRRSSSTSTGFRLYAAWEGCRPGATIDPQPTRSWRRMDERALPGLHDPAPALQGEAGDRSARCSTRCRGWTTRSTSSTGCC